MEANDQLYFPATLPAKERALIPTEGEVKSVCNFRKREKFFAIVGSEIHYHHA
jgi:hypothetical protein